MKYFGWIFLFFIMTYIVPLGSRPMLAPDEFRYAQIPREMIESGNYTSPRLLTVRYFEKTPMNYWLTAGSFKLFGENAFSNRLPSALAVGLTALFIALLIQQTLREEKLAALAAMMYLTCALVFGVGTTAVTDSVFTMFVTGSQGLIFMALNEKKFNRRKFLLLALGGIFIGAGFLTKGFLAFVIPGLTVLAFLLLKKRWIEFLQLPLPLLVFAALTILPWALAIHRAESDFWNYFIFVEHLHRATAGSNAQHSEPWWFYLPILPLSLLPAGMMVLPALSIGRNAWKKIISQDVFFYAMCALIVPLIFFSAVHGKLATYILPVLPPAVILISGGIQSYFNTGGQHRVYNVVLNIWATLLLLTGCTGIAAWICRDLPCLAELLASAPVNQTLLITSGVAAFAGGALLLYTLRSNWRVRMYIFFFGMMLLVLGVSWGIAPSRKMPEKILTAFFANERIDVRNTTIVTTYSFSHATAWSSRKSDIKLLSGSEFRYGNKAALEKGETPVFTDIGNLCELIRNPGRTGSVVVILKEDANFWKILPPAAKTVTDREITFAIYPATAGSAK